MAYAGIVSHAAVQQPASRVGANREDAEAGQGDEPGLEREHATFMNDFVFFAAASDQADRRVAAHCEPSTNRRKCLLFL
jgi:hypothetical protein